MRRLWILLLLVGCAPQPEAPGPVAAPAPLVRGPGGGTLDTDPCPDTPGAPAACQRVVTARRISWFGWLARWEHVYRSLGVPPSNQAGARGQWSADALNLGFGHPDRLLGQLLEPDRIKSQYFALHEIMGEPFDRFGDEITTIATFRQQHSGLVTAAAEKQACRISIGLADRLVRRLYGQRMDAPNLAILDRVLDAQHGAAPSAVSTVRGFRPEFGYFAYGRRLSDSELAALNASFAGDGRDALRTGLAGLMCSTPALVE
jgi:hypothetical protein